MEYCYCRSAIADAMAASSRCAALLHPASARAGARRRPILHGQSFWGTERRRCLEAPLRCNKMYVPGFGEGSPEKKAAMSLQNFFNDVAVKIVLTQLESYNREAYAELMEFVDRNSLNDADSFCKNLIRESPRHKALERNSVTGISSLCFTMETAMRILEVRSAYMKNDFEWDNLQKISFKMVDEANTKLVRDYVLETSHIEDDEQR